MVRVYHYMRATRGDSGTTKDFGTGLNTAVATVSVIFGSDSVYVASDGI